MLKSRRAWVVTMVLVWVGSASATSVEIQLTPENTKVNALVFQVAATDNGESNEVEIVVKPDADKHLSPFRSAILQVYEGNRLVISCPIEKKEQNGELHYHFDVAARDVAKVRFRFNEYGFAKVVEKDEKVTLMPMPSMTSYWLNLEDFVVGKAEPLPPANKARTLMIGLVVLGVAFYVISQRRKGRKFARAS